jgi:hypothetical protein
VQYVQDHVRDNIEFMRHDLNLCKMMSKCQNIDVGEITLERCQKNRKGSVSAVETI